MTRITVQGRDNWQGYCPSTDSDRHRGYGKLQSMGWERPAGEPSILRGAAIIALPFLAMAMAWVAWA